MPNYTDAHIDYIPWNPLARRTTCTFVYDKKPTVISWPPEKSGKPLETRQAHFADQLESLRIVFGNCIPIHISWNGDVKNQMDKGCIGHAFGTELPIRSIGVAPDGAMTHVILWDRNADDR